MRERAGVCLGRYASTWRAAPWRRRLAESRAVVDAEEAAVADVVGDWWATTGVYRKRVFRHRRLLDLPLRDADV